MNGNQDAFLCICDTLRKIDEAQSVVENNKRLSSCNNCMKKFNLPLTKNNFDTIPIMLICKDKCDFFMGSGIFRKPNTMILECFKTPFFRVTKFLDNSDCCVVLELLQPQNEEGEIPSSFIENDIYAFFSDSCITRFVRTGICITVDLNCFCGVECLPAVNACHGIPIPLKKPLKFVQEELCGNFLYGTQTVWEATPGQCIEATFQIFNSADNTANVEGTVSGSPSVIFPPVPPGFTITRSVTLPTAFTISAPQASGSYCIKLLKSIPRNLNSDCKIF